jgi:hypothetical protein
LGIPRADELIFLKDPFYEAFLQSYIKIKESFLLPDPRLFNEVVTDSEKALLE